jgi:hypothetical protein
MLKHFILFCACSQACSFHSGRALLPHIQNHEQPFFAAFVPVFHDILDFPTYVPLEIADGSAQIIFFASCQKMNVI